ncbi:MAG: DUF1638 domain-containing protein [bacterium]|nr:DUF1638 domain-containing protein [bacterium]
MKRLHIIACHVLWRELCYFAAQAPTVCTFQFLPQGLHNTPQLLRQQLQSAIDQFDPTSSPCDAIILGYGLCCNGLEGITARNVPLVAVRAHDCITFLLGSKERYRAYFDAHPGTYWFSPGWIETATMPGPDRVAQLLADYTAKYGPDNARYLVELEYAWMKQYSHATYVDLGIGNADQYRAYTRQCAQSLGWHYHELPGDPSLIQRLLAGHWHPSDFLLVHPGQSILPSHDDAILRTRTTSLSTPLA